MSRESTLLHVLERRLVTCQLPSGGWGFGRLSSQPALEPTCLSLLALRARPDSVPERGLRFLLQAQNPNGSWPAFGGDDRDGCWATALAVTALVNCAQVTPPINRGLGWLLRSKGWESHWLWKWKFRTADTRVRFDPDKFGWPWIPGTCSWVVPTAFSLLALKQSLICGPTREVSFRIKRGVEMLLDRACPDGGWNAGNGVVYGVPLAPHLDATAVALLALRGEQPNETIAKSLDWLEQRTGTCPAPWSLAWSILALHAHGRPTETPIATLAAISGKDAIDDCATLAAVSRLFESRKRFSGDVMTRRTALAGSVGIAASCATAAPFLLPRYDEVRKPARSRVAVLIAESYTRELERELWKALQLFNLDIRGKSVLLKPNLVDYTRGNHINTHPLLVAAAAECFRRLGAASVTVAEGPGHQRDTQLVLAESGFERQLKEQSIPFADLNRDELVETQLRSTYTGLNHLWLPRTVLGADFVVSMPKVKAHHWAGVTLSMKNMFGVVPGTKYGWPKNLLHWRGIQQSIVDICATVPIHFVIADGIMAMEGNGPLNGTPRRLGRIVLADDPVAADATCARLMGLTPESVPHIREGAKFLGNSSAAAIEQLGEPVTGPADPFDVVPEFQYLRIAGPRPCDR